MKKRTMMAENHQRGTMESGVRKKGTCNISHGNLKNDVLESTTVAIMKHFNEADQPF